MAHVYDHLDTNSAPRYTPDTPQDDFSDLIHSPTFRAVSILGAGSLIALGIANGISSEQSESKFDTNPNITTIHLDEGARIRHAPIAETEPPISQLDAPLTLSTPDGIKVRTEFRNGTWYGVNAADIPNFNDHFDDDGIVWINQQKASVESDLAK